jgi:acyl-CoA synthetase (AMP-forming)/AMP-acid ligase II
MADDIFSQFEEETAFRTETAEKYHRHGYWDDMSCSEYLSHNAEEYDDRAAISTDETSLTWEELDRQVSDVAAGLQERGLQKGDRVAFRIPHRVEWYVTRLAVNRAGGISVPLYPRFQEREVRHVIETTEPLIYVGMGPESASTSHLDLVADLQTEQAGLEHVLAVGDAPTGTEPYEALAGDGDPEEVRIDPDYPDTLSLSSGTTGLPKIYYLVQNTYLAGGKDLQARYSITEYDDVLALTPIQQAFGHMVGLYVPLVSGATMHLTTESDPEAQWELFQEIEPTFVVAIPTQTTKIINAAEDRPEDLSHVRTFINGGAPLPKDVAERVEDEGTLVVNDYGAGDGGLSNAGCPADSRETRFSTVGPPQMTMKTKVVDEDGEEVEPGDVGEVIMTGGGCGFGYFQDPERTTEVYDLGGPREGWFHTKDAGKIDERGNLQVVGRMDDMILRGGQNIYPTEIEDALMELGVVNEAAVLGMPDPELGERVCAYVVPAAGADPSLADVTSELEAAGLATFKLPERLETRDELPKSPGGKIKKSTLRDDIEDQIETEGVVE